MRCPFEWVVGDSSKDHHGDRANVQNEAGPGRATPLYGALLGPGALAARRVPRPVQSATPSTLAGTCSRSPRSNANRPGSSRSRAACSSNSSSASLCAEPTCSTLTTSLPRRVSTCTATAPEAVLAFRTNRDTTKSRNHATGNPKRTR